jgi:hypothetical protein
VRWSLPKGCLSASSRVPEGKAVVLAAMGGHDSEMSEFVVDLEIALGLAFLRPHEARPVD